MEKQTTKTLLRGITRCADLIEKNHPDIAEKIRAKDMPLEEIVSDLKKVMRFHVTKEGVTVYIEASKERGI